MLDLESLRIFLLLFLPFFLPFSTPRTKVCPSFLLSFHFFLSRLFFFFFLLSKKLLGFTNEEGKTASDSDMLKSLVFKKSNHLLLIGSTDQQLLDAAKAYEASLSQSDLVRLLVLLLLHGSASSWCMPMYLYVDAPIGQFSLSLSLRKSYPHAAKNPCVSC